MASATKTKAYSYLPDVVVDVEDEFGIHTQIADALADKIIDADVSEQGLSIGLFGEWGSGKSVIVETLRKKLETQPEIAFVNIDVWKYNGIPLLRHILYEIAEQGSNGKFNKTEKERLLSALEYSLKVGESLEPYRNPVYKKILKWLPLANMLSIGITLVIIVVQIVLAVNGITGAVNTGLSLISQLAIPTTMLIGLVRVLNSGVIDEFKKWCDNVSENLLIVDKTIVPTISPEQFEKVFDQIVEKLSKKNISKYVIVFDNIDRCKGDFAYEVLSTIKTYLDKKNCVYIIPCDDMAIKHYLSQEYRSAVSENENKRDFASEFLDKLFTTCFRIPLTDELIRDQFIEKCISMTSLNDLPQRSKIVQVLYYAYKGETPRQIKRYINDLIMYYEIAKKADPEQEFLLDDTETFVVMVAIKQIAPGFEKRLVENPELIWNLSLIMSDLKDLESKRVLNLMKKIQFNFPKEKSVVSYVYFSKAPLEYAFSNVIRNGDCFELTDENIMLAIGRLKADSAREAFLQNDFNSAVKSILKFGVSEYLEKSNEFKNFGNLHIELGGIVEKSIGYQLIFDFLLETKTDDGALLESVFLLFGARMSVQKYKKMFFDRLEKLPNLMVIYEACLKDQSIDFTGVVSEKLSELANQDVLSKDKLTPALLSLLAQIDICGKNECVPHNFIEKILPSIEFTNEEWRDWERNIIVAKNEGLHVDKIDLLIGEVQQIVGTQRASIPGGKKDLKEKLDYLKFFATYPIAILSENNKRLTRNINLKNCFSDILIKFVNYQTYVVDMFILGSKLLGKQFVRDNLQTVLQSFAKKETPIRQLCEDEEFLALLAQTAAALDYVRSDTFVLSLFLENMSESWKVAHVELFIKESYTFDVIKTYYESTAWSDENRTIVLKKMTEQTILRMDRHLTDPNSDENVLIQKISYTAVALKNAYGNCNDLHVGKEIFRNLINEKFETAIKIYSIYKTEICCPDDYLTLILEFLSTTKMIVSVKVPSSVNLSAELERQKSYVGQVDLQKLAKNCVNVANQDTVIRLGLAALMILDEKTEMLSETVGSQLALIKAKGVFVKEIESLLKIDE